MKHNIVLVAASLILSASVAQKAPIIKEEQFAFTNHHRYDIILPTPELAIRCMWGPIRYGEIKANRIRLCYNVKATVPAVGIYLPKDLFIPA